MSAAALEVKGLTKSFGGLPAIADLCMSVATGERRLILGPNGAGKTTLFNLITGDLKSDSGSIRLFGTEVSKLPTKHRAALGLARTYQILTLFPRDTLVHNVVLALLGRSPLRWNPVVDLTERIEFSDEALSVLDRVGLAQCARKHVGETSYGEKRRLEIALALAQKPRLLLLDEPFAGLSADERVQVRDLIASIVDDVAVIMIEHDMDTALAFADRITVLHYGRLIVEGSRADVVTDPRTREVYLGH